jgi:hypothetical protein
MSNVVIDLGEVPARPGAIVTARPPFPFRLALGALSVVLLALLAGGGHLARPAPPTIVPARLGDTTFVDGDRLFVISAGRPVLGAQVQNRTVSTYQLPGGRLIDRTTAAVSGAITWVWRGAGVLAVSYQIETNGNWAVVVVREGTDQVLWRRTDRWVGGSAADGLVLLANDQAELGVDLATGRTRWSVPHPSDGFTEATGPVGGFPRWLVTVTDSGRLETRDPRTGAVIATAAVAKTPGRANGLVWPVGDLMLVDTNGSGFDGYRLPGLQRLWRTAADLTQSWTQADCGVVICTFGRQRGITALEPATGRERWKAERWAYAEAVGPYLIATELERADDQPAAWVLDPATGRPLGNFGSWQVLGRDGDGLIYGVIVEGGTYRVHYALLDPATRGVRVLGTGEEVSGDCEVGAGVLLCRLVDASVALWPLR